MSLGRPLQSRQCAAQLMTRHSERSSRTVYVKECQTQQLLDRHRLGRLLAGPLCRASVMEGGTAYAGRRSALYSMRLANYLSKENSSLLLLVAIVRLARDVVPAYDDPKRTNRCLLFLVHIQYCFDGGHLMRRKFVEF